MPLSLLARRLPSSLENAAFGEDAADAHVMPVVCDIPPPVRFRVHCMWRLIVNRVGSRDRMQPRVPPDSNAHARAGTPCVYTRSSFVACLHELARRGDIYRPDLVPMSITITGALPEMPNEAVPLDTSMITAMTMIITRRNASLRPMGSCSDPCGPRDKKATAPVLSD